MDEIAIGLARIAKLLIADSAMTPEWLIGLNIPTRKPRHVEAIVHQSMMRALKDAYEIKGLESNRFAQQEIEFKKQVFETHISHTRLTKEELEDLYGGKKKEEPNVVKTSQATYTKQDSSSYARFLKNVDAVDKVLKSLSGYHKKAISGLNVRFVGSDDIRSKAKYVRNRDEIWINSGKVKLGDNYGGLPYVIVHELGHRYLRKYPQGWNYDSSEWATTDYSNTDSMSGEEKFAELFAMAHWGSKYSQFMDKIEKFEQILR